MLLFEMINEILEQYSFFEFATIMTINMRTINSAEYTALLMILYNLKVRKISKAKNERKRPSFCPKGQLNLWGHCFFQNPNQKLQRFLPYPVINFQGRNLCNLWLGFRKKWWPHKFILNLTDRPLGEHFYSFFWKYEDKSNCFWIFLTFRSSAWAETWRQPLL